jgi:hypothetical protein
MDMAEFYTRLVERERTALCLTVAVTGPAGPVAVTVKRLPGSLDKLSRVQAVAGPKGLRLKTTRKSRRK